jgi:protein-tyrosine kinase
MSTATRFARGMEWIRWPETWWTFWAKSHPIRAQDITVEEDGHHLHDLVQKLFFCSAEAPRVVLVCGVDRNAGAKRLCGPLARELADQAADDVCLVEDLENSPVDEGSEQLSEQLWRVRLSTDRSRPRVEQWKTHIGWLRQEFRYAVIHSPPLLEASDAVVLGQLCDGLLVVLEAHRTRRLAALRAKTMIESSGVRLLGTILSERTFPIPEAIHRRI